MSESDIFDIDLESLYGKLSRSIAFKKRRYHSTKLDPFFIKTLTIFWDYIEKYGTYDTVGQVNSLAMTISEMGEEMHGKWSFLYHHKLPEYKIAIKKLGVEEDFKNSLIIFFDGSIIYLKGEWTKFSDEEHKSISISIIDNFISGSSEDRSEALEIALFDEIESESKELAEVERGKMFKEDFYKIGPAYISTLDCLTMTLSIMLLTTIPVVGGLWLTYDLFRIYSQSKEFSKMEKNARN